MIEKFWTLTQEKEIDRYIEKHHLPSQLKEEIRNNLVILDTYYKQGRKLDDDGGYVAFVDTEEEYERLLQQHHVKRCHREFRDEICRTETGTYYADLYLVSNDYGIVIIWQERSEKQ